jgi:hypothetical protein
VAGVTIKAIRTTLKKATSVKGITDMWFLLTKRLPYKRYTPNTKLVCCIRLRHHITSTARIVKSAQGDSELKTGGDNVERQSPSFCELSRTVDRAL